MMRVVVRLLIGIVAVATALCAAFVWRLAQGPIDLPLATSYVAQALNAPGGPTFRVRRTELSWDHDAHVLALRVHDVEVASPTGAPIGVLPSLTVALSARALLRGVIVPARVIAHGAHVRLVLRPDGGIGLGLGTEAAEPLASPGRSVADRLFEALAAPASVAWLRVVTLRDGRIDVVDARDGSSWQARDVDVVVGTAGAAGLDAGLTGKLVFGATLVPARIDAAYRQDPRRLEIRLALRGLDPPSVGASMRGSSTLPSVLSDVRVPLDGRLAITLDEALRPQRARLKLTGGAGTVRVAGLPGNVFAIAGLRAALDLSPDDDTLRVPFVSLETPKGSVTARGQVRRLRDERAIDVTVSAADVAVRDLQRYWPEGTASGARRWVVENVRAGSVRRAAARITGRLGDASTGAFALGTLQGSLVFDGVTARYLPTMAPLTRVAGTGTFTDRRLQLRLARGAVGPLELVHGTVDVPADRAGGPAVGVAGGLRGPLASAIALLEQEPSLAPSRTLGLGDVAGTVTADIALTVPLRGRVDVRTLRPSVSARLRNLSLARLPRGLTLADGDLTLELGRGMVTGQGQGRLQGIPVTIVGRGDLDGGSRTLDVEGDVDVAGMAALGFDLRPGVTGVAAVRTRYAALRPGAARVTVDADLARIGIDSSMPAARKHAGTPGSARAVVVLTDGVVSAVEDVALDLAGTEVTGRVTLSDGGGRWRTIDARAVLAAPNGAPGQATLRLDARGGLTVTSPDMGRLVAALASSPEVAGGSLRFTGNRDPAAPGWPVDGLLDVRRFRLTREHIIGRAASLVSLSGIARALSGDGGIEFDGLQADLSHRDGVVTIRSARAGGRTLGVLARGAVDYAAGTLAIQGSLVPAYYGVNQAVGRIPILGQVLTGTDKAGIQVFDFEAKGPLGNPVVTARASSAAPGAVRDLLRLLEGTARR